MRKAVLGLLALAVAGCGGSEAHPAALDSAPAPSTPAVPTPDSAPVPYAPVATPNIAKAPEPAAISWETSASRAVERARTEGRPLLVYFHAMWCAGCMELERKTFTDRRVIAVTARFVMLWSDGTDAESPEVESLKDKYKVAGLPTLVAFGRTGKEQARITEFVPAERFVTGLRDIE